MIKELVAKVGSWMEIVKSLPMDGGPSVTRWVFVRTSEVISLGWLGLVGGAIYRFVKFGTGDIVFCGMITTLGAGLFASAQQTQVAKLNIDKATAEGTVTSTTPLSKTIVTNTETR